MSKTVDGKTTEHVWDGNKQIVVDMDDSDWYSAEVYVRGTNLLARFSKQSGNVKTDYQYYTQNAHGDVVNLTDADGAVIKSYTYDAFGVEVDPNSGDVNVFRFCGEYFDTETGTIYLRARYYQASIGRFISRDSVTGKNTDPLSLNLYTYCHNNPVYFYDPSGHSVFDKIGKAIKSKFDAGVSEIKKQTREGNLDLILDKTLSASKDSNDIYHIRQKCYQEPFGYNNLYDKIFAAATSVTGTSMDKRRYEFSVGDSESLFSIFTPSSKRSIIKREGGEKRCGKRIRAM